MLKVKNNKNQLINTAYSWARFWHKGQKRNNGQPYIVHPVSVAHKVSLYTNDPHIIAAALNHDVLEDCDVTMATLIEKIGLKAASIVYEVTDPKDMPFAERIAWRLATIKNISPAAQLIKTADIDDNLTDPSTYPAQRRILQYVENRISILLDINSIYSNRVANRLMDWRDNYVKNI